jgi:hypothetical protein
LYLGRQKANTPIVIREAKSDYSYCNEGDQKAITPIVIKEIKTITAIVS